ncbi:hypothetical protein CEXT_655971 [Caerostris extrusa]|uniref:Uncharacterized protein n=1 Tax=Caerostris extrusa TaxID=172846 RepID=A0AAV4QPZ0_CAEEX|nr:hypothetical protein CEXT_655971 [Caerostris extrusa]
MYSFLPSFSCAIFDVVEVPNFHWELMVSGFHFRVLLKRLFEDEIEKCFIIQRFRGIFKKRAVTSQKRVTAKRQDHPVRERASSLGRIFHRRVPHASPFPP